MQAVWGKGLLKEKNILLGFQYSFIAEENDRVELAASNLYRLFINGELVGYGPARAAHGYSRLDSYSLSAYAGKSVEIAVEVYSANVNTYYTVEEPPFFAAELYRGAQLLAEAKDFTAYHNTSRLQKTRRFSFQRTFSEVYRLDAVCPVIETEAVPMNQLLPRYVSYPTLEKLPGTVVERGTVTLDDTVPFYQDRAYNELDQVLYKGFYPEELEADAPKDLAGISFTPANLTALSPMTYQLYDFGRSLSGFFSLQVNATDAATLYILFDEALADGVVNPFRNRCCNIIKYTLPLGSHDLLTFEANCARYAAVVVTDGQVDIADFGMVLYENPDVLPLQDYGDEELNAIVAAAANSFSQNAVDILTDCPSRERAGWLCDSYFSGRAEAFFTGKNLVEKSFLENYARYETRPGLPEKMLPMCYPADQYHGKYIPNWTMWYILELQQYVERTGDAELKALSQPKVRGLLDYFKQFENEYGLLENLEGWIFVEWSKCNHADYVAGLNFPSNMLWAAALEAAARLYGWQELTEKAAAMKEAIRKLSWNGEFFEENMRRDDAGQLQKTGHTTETCQYYAFYFGTATPADYPELWQLLRTTFGPGRNAETVYPEVYPSNAIVGNYLRLELLLENGYHSQVLQECKDFFLQMARLTGTLWEHSRLSSSLNHGFASIAAQYIHQCIK